MQVKHARVQQPSNQLLTKLCQDAFNQLVSFSIVRGCMAALTLVHQVVEKLHDGHVGLFVVKGGGQHTALEDG